VLCDNIASSQFGLYICQNFSANWAEPRSCVKPTMFPYFHQSFDLNDQDDDFSARYLFILFLT